MECKIVEYCVNDDLEIMLKESAVAPFKLCYQHLPERISNVKLGIVLKVKLSLGLINRTITSGGVDI
jgi:hypothetical protein